MKSSLLLHFLFSLFKFLFASSVCAPELLTGETKSCDSFLPLESSSPPPTPSSHPPMVSKPDVSSSVCGLKPQPGDSSQGAKRLIRGTQANKGKPGFRGNFSYTLSISNPNSKSKRQLVTSAENRKDTKRPKSTSTVPELSLLAIYSFNLCLVFLMSCKMTNLR